jgi:hypothetical protein
MANNGKTLSKNRPKKNSLDQMAKRPIYRHAGNRPTFERTPCVRTRQLSAVERSTHGRPQITTRAGSVRRGLTGLRSSSTLRSNALLESSHHFMSTFGNSSDDASCKGRGYFLWWSRFRAVYKSVDIDAL